MSESVDIYFNEKAMTLNFDKICRLCLRFCRDYIDLSKENEAMTVIDRIRSCYLIQIDPSEPLPSKVCNQCVQILTLFYVTKANIATTDQLLKNIVYIRHKIKLSGSKCLEKKILEKHSDEIESLPENKKIDVSVNDVTHCESSQQRDEIIVPTHQVCGVDHAKTDYWKYIYKKKLSSYTKQKKRAEQNLRSKKNTKSQVKIQNKKAKFNVRNKTESTEKNLNDTNKIIQEMKVKSNPDTLKEANQLKEKYLLEDKNGCNTEEKKAVKSIGTVIDENNILSPDVKRCKKNFDKRLIINKSNLTTCDNQSILKFYQSGKTISEIASKFGVQSNTVIKIIKNWKERRKINITFKLNTNRSKRK